MLKLNSIVILSSCFSYLLVSSHPIGKNNNLHSGSRTYSTVHLVDSIIILCFNLFNTAQNQGTRSGLPGGLQLDNVGHLVGLAGVLGGAGGILYNVAKGDDNIQIKPTLGGAVDQNGQIVPQFGLSAQAGSGEFRPAVNFGGQLGQDGLSPFVTGGVGVGNGPVSGGLNSGFSFNQNGQVQSQVGGNVGLGGLNLGRPTNGQGIGGFQGINFG